MFSKMTKALNRQREMRLRVLLTNGKKTIDLYWLKHNGTDVYYGMVGSGLKSSYHSSGARHSKSNEGQFNKYSNGLRLDSIKGIVHLETIGFLPGLIDVPNLVIPEYTGKKANSFLYLDTRTLPSVPNISLCLLEPNPLSLLKLSAYPGLQQILTITNTTPWIALSVLDVGYLTTKNTADKN